MNDKKILVIGSANADLTIHTARMPSLGETLTGSSFSVNCGGKGGNQAVAVARLGGNVSFLGAVGDDANGKMLLDNLNNENVKFEGIVVENESTGTAVITVVNGDNFIILDRGANALITPDVIRASENIIKEYDYIIMQLEIPIDSVSEAARIGKKHGKTVVLNPAPYIELPDELYTLTDIIIPNEHEARLMTGIEPKDNDSYKKSVDYIRQKGVKSVLITLGDKGCVYNTEDGVCTVPAVKVNAVDTTSAGDSFIGALATRLSRGECMKTAVEYAVKVSSITVTRHGASASIPYETEIN